MKKLLLSAMALLTAASSFAVTDGQTYETIDGIQVESVWAYTRMLGNNADFAPIAATSSRTIAVNDGVLYVATSNDTDPLIYEETDGVITYTAACAAVYKYGLYTGEYLDMLKIYCEGERVSGTLCGNQIGFDAFGNFYLIGASFSGAEIPVYAVDTETGAATKLATLTREEDESRIDYYDVAGDITLAEADGVIMATGDTNLNLFKWTGSKGGEWGKGWYDGMSSIMPMNASYDGETAWASASIVSILPGADGAEYAAENFYIDGTYTYPALYNSAGEVIDSFEGVSEDYQPVKSPNGIEEVAFGGKNLLFYAIKDYSNNQIRISEFGDDYTLAGMTECWKIPANETGFGETSDYGTRIHGIAFERCEADANGKEAMYLAYFRCYNGVGVYYFSEEGYAGSVSADLADAATSIVVKGDAIVAEGAETIAVYNMAGQVVAQAAAAQVAAPAAGVYVVAATVKGEKVVAKVIVK